MLKECSVSEVEWKNLPHDLHLKLSRSMCPAAETEKQRMSAQPYRESVAGLVWIAQNTRPDIVLTVGVLCRYNFNPGEQHKFAALHVLRYPAGTTSMVMRFKKRESALSSLTCCCDSNWAGDSETAQSTTGCIFKIGNSPISWKSRLQCSVATFTVQVEYQAVYDVCREAGY